MRVRSTSPGRCCCTATEVFKNPTQDIWLRSKSRLKVFLSISLKGSLLSVFSKACNDMRVSSGSGRVAARRSTAIFRIHYCLHVEFLRAARHISKAYEKPFNVARIISDELPSDSDGCKKIYIDYLLYSAILISFLTFVKLAILCLSIHKMQ